LRWAVAIAALGRAICRVALLRTVAATRRTVGAVPLGATVAAVSPVATVVRAICGAIIAAAIRRARGFAVADRNVGKRRVGGLLGLGGVAVALFAHRAAGGSLDVAVRSHGEPVSS
jgi:hypothetical protein